MAANKPVISEVNVANVGAVNTPRIPSSTNSKQGGTVLTGSIGESPGDGRL